MQRFEGKVALITGAGSGIGHAITKRLCAVYTIDNGITIS